VNEVGSCTEEKACPRRAGAAPFAPWGGVVYESFRPPFDESSVIIEELVEPLLVTMNKIRSSTCSSPRSGAAWPQLISGIGVGRRARFRPLLDGESSSFGACGAVVRAW
jgi:hypothetical protein